MLDKTEKVSFFDIKKIPLPNELNPVVDVTYVDNQIKLHYKDETEVTLGGLAPEAPVSVTSVQLVEGDLVIEFSDNRVLNVGRVVGENNYSLPGTSGTGLWNGTEFIELASDTSEITIDETESAFVISGPSNPDYSTEQYVNLRNDASGGGTIVTSSVLAPPLFEQWYTLPLTSIDTNLSGASLENSLFELPAGLYLFKVRTNLYIGSLKLGIVDVETGTFLGETQPTSGYGTNPSDALIVDGSYFKLPESRTLSLVYFAGGNSASRVGMARVGGSWGSTGDRLSLELWKVEDDGLGTYPAPFKRTVVHDVMTAYTSGNQEVLYSSEYDTRFRAWKAFSGQPIVNGEDTWISRQGTDLVNTNEWIGIKFTNGPRKINGFYFWLRNGAAAHSPAVYELQGRNLDTDDWIVLGEFEDRFNVGQGNIREHLNLDEFEYSQYRLYIDEVNHTGSTAVGSRYVAVAKLYFVYDDYVNLD